MVLSVVYTVSKRKGNLVLETSVGSGAHPSPQQPAGDQSHKLGSRLPLLSASVRFVKKTLEGSPTDNRVEAPQALTCNTNTGVRIDPPPRSSNRRRLGGGGVKKIIGWEG